MKIALLLLAGLLAPAQEYDLLIRNARVLDGAGNPWFRADAAVKDGRIAAVGRLAGKTAARVVEARERILAPGFIDVHTHADRGLGNMPAAENFLRDGVATIVTGNCGGSHLDLEAWFAVIEKLGPGVNVASLFGHNTAREEVMGRANRQATSEEMERMRALVERAMKAGAVGFSTGLEYVPGTYAASEEVIELARAAARFGGVYATHMRDEGERVLEAMEEAVRVGREAGLPVQISHLKQDTKRRWGLAPKMLALIEKARSGGVDVTADQYPYDAYSTGLTFLLPSWALADGSAAVRERLKSAETRARIVRETAATVRGKGNQDLDWVRVASAPAKREWEGRTVQAIHRSMGRAAGLEAECETLIDLIAGGAGSGVYRSMSEADIERILQSKLVAVASDGGVVASGEGRPHPRSYGTNARVLSLYARDRGVLSLEQAVFKMTALPARSFGLRDRGMIREGMAADLVLFDPARVADRATFDEPHQYATGFDLVVVNGRIALEDGRLADERAGRVLRRGQ
jgi:N-acyl-D-amino-acid deacylase